MKLKLPSYQKMKKFSDMLSHFHAAYEFNGRTDRQTDRRTDRGNYDSKYCALYAEC